jgi:SAM-dependent methyltransferase
VYDVQRRVDTHRMIARENLNVDSPNLHHSQMYMVSWTKTLKTAFYEIIRRIDLDEFAFIDLGCGKGKAVLLARELQILGKDPQYYLGIDFSEDLIEIAKSNCNELFQDFGNFLVQDVLEIDWAKLPEKCLSIYTTLLMN